MIHFTSDTHFYHKNIIKYQPVQRGHFADIHEMNDGLVENWNRVVAVNDTVWHLGDFAFTGHKGVTKILERLNGRIILCAGNHDSVFKPDLVRTYLQSGLLYDFHGTYWEMGWRYGNKKIEFVLNHYAQRVWNKAHHGAIHLYGHSHGSLPGYGKSVDVGVDSEEMAAWTGDTLRPWSIHEVVAYMATREIAIADHHTPASSKERL